MNLKYFLLTLIFYTQILCLDNSIPSYENCDICWSQTQKAFMIKLTCEHKYCKVCLQQMVKLSLKEKQTRMLCCPNQKCKIKLDETDINSITDNNDELFNKFNKIKYMESLQSQKNYRHCPTPNCNYAFIIDGKTKKCPNCSHSYCQNCLILHNKFTTCQQARDLEFNRSLLKLMHQNTKQCPKCHEYIEKESGCDHMKCIRCDHNFCWNCLQPNHKMNHDSKCKAKSKYILDDTSKIRKCCTCCFTTCCLCCILATKVLRKLCICLGPVQETME
ncbi:MAG: IBR domain-containing protein [Candidatus Babeliales bacterium]|nr:IBR domain-containing protein [Candidatus Babeliales bacterium]